MYTDGPMDWPAGRNLQPGRSLSQHVCRRRQLVGHHSRHLFKDTISSRLANVPRRQVARFAAFVIRTRGDCNKLSSLPRPPRLIRRDRNFINQSVMFSLLSSAGSAGIAPGDAAKSWRPTFFIFLAPVVALIDLFGRLVLFYTFFLGSGKSVTRP